MMFDVLLVALFLLFVGLCVISRQLNQILKQLKRME